jgi:kynurenine formamidase
MLRRMTVWFGIFMLVSTALPALSSATEIDLDAWELIDLTHPFSDETIYRPAPPAEFRLDRLAYGEEAARLLVEQRRVAMLGIDTASIDHGPSRSFVVHQVASAGNVPALENLTGLDRLPPRGALLFALPMKIEGGFGGVPGDHRESAG